MAPDLPTGLKLFDQFKPDAAGGPGLPGGSGIELIRHAAKTCPA